MRAYMYVPLLYTVHVVNLIRVGLTETSDSLGKERLYFLGRNIITLMGILQLQNNTQIKEKIYNSRITHCLETTHFLLFESLSIVKGTCIQNPLANL